jgi:hypothetical protein
MAKPLSREAQFRSFSNLRQEQSVARIEAQPFVVRKLKKDGSFSQDVPFLVDGCSTLEAAQARQAELERLNPKNRYGIERA